MYTKSWSLLAVTFCLLLEYHETNAAVTLLVESPGPFRNSSVLESKVREANRNEIERVSETTVLTKDKERQGAWRTEKGDLVKLQYLNLNVQSTRNASPLQERSDESSENSVHESTTRYVADSQMHSDGLYGTKTSHRMQRTFWPFTSLFGYDYPPPYGPYGPPLLPPYGGGFGFGYPGPLAPPPPLLGLGFSFGL